MITYTKNDKKITINIKGFSIGAVIAAVISYVLNHSIWWAIFHCLFNWMYIAYAFIAYSKVILPALKLMFGI